MHELKPKAWHGWLLLFQIVSCLAVAALLVCCPMEEMYREVFEGAMVCLICPTATAAAVITGKLGGSASSLTTYTLLSNLLAAVAVPLVFPWVEPHANITFFAAFLKILSKVFPLLLLPFFIAWFLRVFVKRCIGICLNSTMPLSICGQWRLPLCLGRLCVLWRIATLRFCGSLDCFGRFDNLLCSILSGKRIGGHYNDRISGGQALGQKTQFLPFGCLIRI